MYFYPSAWENSKICCNSIDPNFSILEVSDFGFERFSNQPGSQTGPFLNYRFGGRIDFWINLSFFCFFWASLNFCGNFSKHFHNFLWEKFFVFCQKIIFFVFFFEFAEYKKIFGVFGAIWGLKLPGGKKTGIRTKSVKPGLTGFAWVNRSSWTNDRMIGIRRLLI